MIGQTKGIVVSRIADLRNLILKAKYAYYYSGELHA
jgi:hypothetical protein